MRTPCCHSFLSFLLKFLHFLQTFAGISLILYSIYLLNQWNHHNSAPHHPIPAPTPANFDGFPVKFGSLPVLDKVEPLKLFGDGFEVDGEEKLNSVELPAPWFIYATMGLGIVLCSISCIGHIAAEVINGCCLCFYTILAAVLILLEGALVAFIAIDRNWEMDIPYDPTGDVDNFRNFIEDNADICKWVGIAVVIVQALALLLSLVLRSMVSTRPVEDDIEGDYDVRVRTREPLLNSQVGQASGSVKGDSDIWSSRMREKYGLHGGDPK